MSLLPPLATTTRLVARALGRTDAELGDATVVAEEHDLDAVAAFRARELGGRIAWDDRTYLSWRYGAPARASGFGALHLLKDGTAPIAILGTESMRLRVGDQVIDGCCVQDILVDRRYRDSGIALWLNQRAFERPGFTMAVGGNEQSIGTVRRAYPTLLTSTLLVLPVDVRDYARRRLGLGPMGRHVGGAANLALSAARGVNRLALRGSGIEVVEAERFDDDIVEHSSGGARRDRVQVVRAAGQLNWRLIDNPRRRYTLLVARRDGRPVGFAVCAVSAPDAAAPWMHLIDWSVSPRFAAAALAALAAELVARARRAGCERVQATVVQGTPDRWLAKTGFITRPASAMHLIGVRFGEGSLPVAPPASAWSLTDLVSDWDY